MHRVPWRNTACAVLENVYLGLWVLCFELRWLWGEGLTMDRHLTALRKQRDELRNELARRTVVADPGASETESSLTLLEEDLARLEALRESRHAERLTALRARFPRESWS